MTKEICWECGAMTGNSGRDEDSLYHNNDGPYCLECWEDERPESITITREEFEKWASEPPREWSIDVFEIDEQYAGMFLDDRTQQAWEAVQWATSEKIQ